MEKIVVKAVKREGNRKMAKHLRAQGLIPAVVYGKDFETVSVSIDLKDMTKLLKEVSMSTIFTLDIEGEETLALIRDLQRDIFLGDLTHMDFLAVSRGVKVRTSVQIVLEGEAPAESEGAIIMTGLDSLDLEATPTNIPQFIQADISQILTIGDSISVADLAIPEGVEIFNDPSDMVVTAVAPQLQDDIEEEEDVEDLEIEDDDAEPEVIAKGKEEDEE